MVHGIKLMHEVSEKRIMLSKQNQNGGIMFKKRAKEQGAIYIAGNTSAIILGPLKDIANSVKTVVLHIDDGEAVLVNNIQHPGNSKFRGTIYGFEPSPHLWDGEVPFIHYAPIYLASLSVITGSAP